MEILYGCIVPQGLTIGHERLKLEAKLEAQMFDSFSSPSLSAPLVLSFAALQLAGTLLQAWGEVSQRPARLCLSALSSSPDQRA